MKYARRFTLMVTVWVAGCLSLSVNADDHGDQPKSLPMALWSTYEIPAGAKPSEIEASLVEYLKAEEARSFNNCSMYRHEFGSPRAFYTTCTFDDIDHFARIMDGSPPASTPDEPQLFGSHSDHLVMTTQQNMTKAPQYVLIAATTFAPELSNAEMQEKAGEFYSAYDEAFGSCNRYEHAWGPELAFYTSCGFEKYADFAVGVNRVMKIFEARLHTANLMIQSHRDDILVKVMD
jgi:hypothetical protein